MKSKNIFLTIAFALFLFGACSEEKIIDGPDVIGKAPLTLELSTSSSPITKSSNEREYQYATEEELTVNDCWVFIVKDGKIEKKKYFPNISNAYNDYKEEGGNRTYKKGYLIIFENLEYGDYDFYVIANPSFGNRSKYEGCASLIDLKNILEGSDKYASTFNSGNLLKMGHKSVRFTEENKNIEIPLTQLAAKVKVNLTIGGPSIDFKSMTSLISNIRTRTLIFDPMYDIKNIWSGGVYEITDVLSVKEIVFYTYGKPKDDMLKVKLEGVYNKDSKYSSNFQIEIPEKTTEGCIKNGYFYEVTASIKSIPVQGSLGVEIEQVRAFKDGEEIKFEFN